MNSYLGVHDVERVTFEPSHKMPCGKWVTGLKFYSSDGGLHEVSLYSDEPLTLSIEQQQAIEEPK